MYTNFVIKNLPTRKTPVPEEFVGKLYETFKEKLISVIYKLIQKAEEEEILPKLYYDINQNKKGRKTYKNSNNNKTTD